MRSCVLVLMAAACQREAAAQASDPLGPVQCFQAVTAIGISLAESDAITLCGGAINAAPAQCFVAATTRTGLSEQQTEQLCYRTTTLEPLACYANLAATNQFTEQQMIEFCGSQCAAGPPPPQSFGARSAGPGYCFIAAERSSTLSGDQVINLCADTTHCQYPGSYGNAYGAGAATAYGSPAVPGTVPRTPGY